MSQEQPWRSPEPVKYGDVFAVSGQLASQPIKPQDAATLQAAETAAYGQTIKGGPAAVLQSAADFNERSGAIGHGDITDAVRDRGATIAEAEVGGYSIITEAVGGQVVGQYGQPIDMEIDKRKSVAAAGDEDPVTIGEALEATALSVGDKPIDHSDAAAIQAAEVRTTGLGHLVPGGVGAVAQSALAYNMQTAREEDKATLADVLTDATDKLVGDKAATKEDAEGQGRIQNFFLAGAQNTVEHTPSVPFNLGVIYAEIRNKDDFTANPGGIAAAARINQQK